MMTFKERYDNDPEFKATHKKYIMTKIKCECGHELMRCNMTRHKQNRIHQNYEKKNIEELSQQVSEIEEKLVFLQAKIKSLKL